MSAADLILPILYAAVLWWASTGAILALCARPRRMHRGIMALATGALPLAVIGVALSAWNASVAGAYAAFTGAIAVWAWIEIGFLLGFVTGPRKAPCPDKAHGWERFRLAAGALMHHELVIVGAALGLVAVTWGAPNQTGVLTFAALMALRLSAKLNIFLGVPNINYEFVPGHLAYLTSYFRKGRATALFPLTVAAGLGAAVLAAEQVAVAAEPGAGTGFVLVFAIVILGLLEHLFMVLPLQDAALWRWVLPAADGSREKRRQ